MTTIKAAGFTVFFTGLPCSGKTTLAVSLASEIERRYSRAVTLLDGDEVRKHLSTELGFSKEHRDINVKRVAFVASEITRHDGIAICSLVAPYSAARDAARQMIEKYGKFVLVYVSTPLSVCEGRDIKGMYAGARAGEIKTFTGISDVFEAPGNAEVVVDTSLSTVEKSVETLLSYLEQQ